MHIVVLRHYEKSDPDAVYYGSLREAVSAVEPGSKLFSVWGGSLNAELARFEPEDISEDFLAAWIALRRAHLAEHYWSGEAKHEYGARDLDLERYLTDEVNAPAFVFTGTSPSRHGRVYPGHPRLNDGDADKAWITGTSPVMTNENAARKEA